MPKRQLRSQMRLETAPPLDFSWKEIKSCEDLAAEEPWSGKRKPLRSRRREAEEGEEKDAGVGGEEGGDAGAAVGGISGGVGGGGGSAGGAGGASSGGAVVTTRTKSGGKGKKKPPVVVAVRLNNNQLTELTGWAAALSSILWYPERLAWVDLSFNQLATVPAELLENTELSVLYLHANAITRLAEVNKLAKLKKLKSLALHGNPIEEKKIYRNYVIVHLPELRQLDFSPITRLDREKAATWWRSSPIRRRRAERRAVMEASGASPSGAPAEAAS